MIKERTKEMLLALYTINNKFGFNTVCSHYWTIFVNHNRKEFNFFNTDEWNLFDRDNLSTIMTIQHQLQ